MKHYTVLILRGYCVDETYLAHVDAEDVSGAQEAALKEALIIDYPDSHPDHPDHPDFVKYHLEEDYLAGFPILMVIEGHHQDIKDCP